MRFIHHKHPTEPIRATGFLWGDKPNLFPVDNFAPLLDVGEHVVGGEDGLTHTLLMYLAVGLASLRVGSVEHKPSWVKQSGNVVISAQNRAYYDSSTMYTVHSMHTELSIHIHVHVA